MADTELLGVLQEICKKVQEGTKPAEMALGKVISVSPLRVQKEDSGLKIPEAGLILTDAVKEWEEEVYNLQTPPVLIGKVYHKGLKSGDSVLMLQVSKGNKYIILSRTGEGA